MSVTVRTSTGPSVSVSQGSQGTSSVVIKKGDNLTVQSLSNVVSTDLQDGYTIVYDSETKKWVTQQVPAGTVTAVDGGTY